MYKKILCLLALIYSVNVFATEQIPDLLIIGKDTVFLGEFPLEQLDMKHRPFGTRDGFSTDCWRGYVAIWRIIDNKLFLEKIIDCIYESGYENTIKLFEKNNIQYQEKNGLIFANWCTINFYKLLSHSFTDEILYTRKWKNWDNKLVLQIENGIILKNELPASADLQSVPIKQSKEKNE